jgi:hypothetical protein
MGTVTAGTIINKAAIQLADLNTVRWTRAELLSWLNMAQQALILAIPESSAVTTNVTTVAGARQSIPNDGWILLSANRNMGISGTISGRSLEETRKEVLTKNSPSWTSDAGTSFATAYIYNPLDKTVFWIYPPADYSGNKIEITYSQSPLPMTAEYQAILVSDIYEPILLDYVLYKACMKDAEYAPGVELAKGYLATFSTLIAALQSSTRSVPAEMDKA